MTTRDDDVRHDVRYTVTLLGGFGLAAGGTCVPLTAREQRVTALLALHGSQTRARVAGLLWPDTDEHRARQNLRAAVATLARQAPGLVVSTHLDLTILADVDSRAFVAAAQDVLAAASGAVDPGDPGARLAVLATALVGDGPLAGDLLPGWYDDWVLVEAERLRHLRLHALERLSALLSAREAYGLALEVALAAVALDPLRESAHRAVIEVHASEGNVATALAQHERYRTRLARELQIAPSPRMDALLARLTGCPVPPSTPGRSAWSPARADRTAQAHVRRGP